MEAGKGQLPLVRRIIRSKTVWIIVGAGLFVWLNNSSLLVDRTGKEAALVAHAALGQTYDLAEVRWDTNTAAIIHVPEHRYIENTLPSMRAAFAFGADVVEFDIRLTKDRRLAVFHDDRLDHRTDGTGPVSAHTMEELRQLDVGYGYTADKGGTFPLRGTGRGLMIPIEEVFRGIPDGTFLIHLKDGGNEVGPVLLKLMANLRESQIARLSVYGNDAALSLIRQRYPRVRILSMRRLRRALLSYELLGWSGYVPRSIRNMELHLPLRYAKLLWGWPDQFLQRMDSANTRVVLVRYVNGWSAGFDSEAQLAQLPASYTGAVWTNRVDIVGPLLKE